MSKTNETGTLKTTTKKTTRSKEEAKKDLQMLVAEGSVAAGTIAAATVLAATGNMPAYAAMAGTSTVLHSLKAFNKYRSAPLNKSTAAVEPVSDTWAGRPKANLVKWLMLQTNTEIEKVADYLGISVGYLNIKLTRDSFSFDDLVLAAYACGYSFVVINNDVEVNDPNFYRIDMLKYFENNEDQVLERIAEIEEKEHREKREEYERKKAELARMKEEYGFED